MTTKKQVLDYTLYITGVWGRNRTRKSKVFTLAYDQEKPIPPKQLLEMTDAKLIEIKAKPGAEIKVKEQPTEVEKEEGIIIRSFMCFTDRLLIREVWKGKGI